MKHFKFNVLIITITAYILTSCGFAEEMTDRAADSPEGMQLAYVINLDNTTADIANRTWSDFIAKRKSKTMRIKGSRVYQASKVPISGLTGDITVKSLFEQSGSNTEMRLWFVKNNEYLTPQNDPASYDIIDRFIDDYFTDLEAAQIQLEVDQEVKKLNDLEKELSRLRKNNENLHNDITKAEKTIKESRMKIEENLRAQDQMSDKILEQKKVIEQTKNKLSGI